ncbi:MAG: TIGR03943 family putative permease subunit [Actinomycetota bacterium]
MTRRFSCLLTIVLGVLTLKVVFSGEYLNYVRPGMLPWLLLSGAVLIFLGVSGWLAWRKDLSSMPEDHGDCALHHHHPLSQASWLLLLPVVAAGLILPTPLGSFAADRQAVRPPRPPAKVADLADLAEQLAALQLAAPAGLASVPDGVADPAAGAGAAGSTQNPAGTPVDPAAGAASAAPPVSGAPGATDAKPAGDNPAVPEMSLLDFLEITYYDETQALAGIPVRLVGFAMPGQGLARDRFLLSRFMISCCAADAQLMQAAVIDPKEISPGKDVWVEVTGTWDPAGAGETTVDGFPVPTLVASRIQVIPAPEIPYLTLTL